MKEEINTLLEALTDSKNNNIGPALEKILNVVLSDSSAALLAISSLPESDTKEVMLHLFRPIAGLGMALSAVKNHFSIDQSEQLDRDAEEHIDDVSS